MIHGADQQIRCFLAASLSTDVLRNLDEAQKKLRSELETLGRAVRWVPIQNIHLTMKFFGEISIALTAEIERTLTRLLRREEPIEIEVAGLSAFPRPDRARVVWAGVREPHRPRLEEIHRHIEQSLEELGFERESRPFRPHLTLARIRPVKDRTDVSGSLSPLADELFGRSTLRELTLYRSDLEPGGARYTPLSRVFFQEPQTPQS